MKDRINFKIYGRNAVARVFESIPAVESFEPGHVMSQFIKCDKVAGASFDGDLSDGYYEFYLVDELFSDQIESMDEYESNHEEYYIAVFVPDDDFGDTQDEI